MLLSYHDRQSDLRMLDDTRRFYMKRTPLILAARARLDEMTEERDRLSKLIDDVFAKLDITREKGLARLAQVQPYDQVTDELRGLVLAHSAFRTLNLVMDGYRGLIDIASNDDCVAIGTIVSRPAEGDTSIGVSASEYRALFTKFDAAAFRAALEENFPAPAARMGVGTALRQPAHAAYPGAIVGEMTMGIASLKD